MLSRLLMSRLVSPVPASLSAGLPVRWLHPARLPPRIARRRAAAGQCACSAVALAAARRWKVARASSKESEGKPKIREIFEGVNFPEELGGRQRIEYALWLAYRRMGNPRPPSKEIEEIFAFFNACSKQVGQRRILIDAAGSDLSNE